MQHAAEAAAAHDELRGDFIDEERRVQHLGTQIPVLLLFRCSLAGFTTSQAWRSLPMETSARATSSRGNSPYMQQIGACDVLVVEGALFRNEVNEASQQARPLRFAGRGLQIPQRTEKTLPNSLPSGRTDSHLPVMRNTPAVRILGSIQTRILWRRAPQT